MKPSQGGVQQSIGRSHSGSMSHAIWLLPLLAAALLFGAGLLMPPRSITITMGREAGLNAQGQGKDLYNFFGWGNPGTEKGQSARRIDPIASLMIPWAFRLGEPLELELVMCGCGSTAPVRLLINGIPHSVPLTEAWKRQHFTVPYTPTIYEQSLYLEWQSTASPRPLVHAVDVRAQSPQDGLTGAFWFGIAVTLALLPGRSQPVHHRLIWVGVMTVSAVVSRMFYEPQVLPWGALVALGGFAAALLVALCPDLRYRLVLLAGVLWLLAIPQLLGTWILDDAFISFRYARNLIDGYGLTFNPGGEVVEGYTNFLWTILMTGVMAVGFEPVVAAQVLCTGLSIATLLLVYRFALAWWPGQIWCVLPPLLLVANPSFLLYTTRGSGMETALVTFLALVALWLLWRTQSFGSGLTAGLVCALVVMARPDGALVPVAGGLVLLWKAASGKQKVTSCAEKSNQEAASRAAEATSVRSLFKFPTMFDQGVMGLVVGFLLLYAPYFVWRYSYYGYLLPNTFYAKTGATTAQVLRGFAYTREFIGSLGLRSLIVLLGFSSMGLIGKLFRSHTTLGPAWYLWLFVLLTCGYVTGIGGDHFPLGRFFVPIVPVLALLLTHGVVQSWELSALLNKRLEMPEPGRRAGLILPVVAGLAALLFVVVNVSPLPHLDSRDPSGRIWGENRVALKNRELGWWFYLNTPPDTVVATGIAGAMPFYGQRYVIDTLGLNDTYIAHLPVSTLGQGIAGAEKTDVQYVLSRQPNYVPFSTSGPFQDVAAFQQMYEQIIVRGPEGGEIVLYRRRE